MIKLIPTLSLISILVALSACGKKEVETPPAPEAVEPTVSEIAVAELTAEAEAMVESAQAEVDETVAEVEAEVAAQVDAVVKEAEAQLTEAIADQAADSAKEEATKSLESLIPKF